MRNLFIIAFVVFVSKANAQLSDPFDMIRNPINYDSIVHFINDSSSYNSPRLEDAYLQSLGTLYSFIGNYNKAEELFIIRDTKKGYIPEHKEELQLKGFGVNQDTLVKLYKQYNVVMFNEAHHMPQHRAFLYSQLEVLKELGFTQLALEALNDEDTEISTRAYPVNNNPELITGVYISEPVYGNLLRHAIELGFTLIPYETFKLRREKGQAKNIFSQYNKEQGKLLILAGYGHIEEKFPMMAYHLKKMLNEELLSICQHTKFDIEPVFPNSDNKDFYLQKDPNECYDYCLYHKPLLSDSNIPYWYTWMNFKHVDFANLYDEAINGSFIVQLFNPNEVYGIPIYQYFSEESTEIKIAYPKSDTYKLKILSKEKTVEKLVNL
ncbi:hypothetical protein [Saccharicrinis aurantiacus]|uniref:hypothetical protein n=1 Tax=Saccharicrinis aurantiacus TaxID=1849719 RepID=UPI0009502ABF|nr:hypothetical protein [Saccharicrinis aurantiacus]